MQIQQTHGKLLTVRDGWLVCPVCRRNRRLKRVYPDETGERVSVWCKDCKSDLRIDIYRGQCFESRSQ